MRFRSWWRAWPPCRRWQIEAPDLHLPLVRSPTRRMLAHALASRQSRFLDISLPRHPSRWVSTKSFFSLPRMHSARSVTVSRVNGILRESPFLESRMVSQFSKRSTSRTCKASISPLRSPKLKPISTRQRSHGSRALLKSILYAGSSTNPSRGFDSRSFRGNAGMRSISSMRAPAATWCIEKFRVFKPKRKAGISTIPGAASHDGPTFFQGCIGGIARF